MNRAIERKLRRIVGIVILVGMVSGSAAIAEPKVPPQTDIEQRLASDCLLARKRNKLCVIEDLDDLMRNPRLTGTICFQQPPKWPWLLFTFHKQIVKTDAGL